MALRIRLHFQHDNAQIYTSLETRQWLAANSVTTMKWSAQSQDLSPIEDMWDFLAQTKFSSSFMYRALQAGFRWVR